MGSGKPLIISGNRVLLAEGLMEAALVVESGWITDIIWKPQRLADDAVVSIENAILSPGFIDTQVNGGGGVLFNAAPHARTIQAIGEAHRGLGVTGFLPTWITGPVDGMQAAGRAFSQASADPAVLGIHFEGPFLNSEKAGIHDRSCIRRMTPDDRDFFRSLAAAHRDRRVLLTLAPECVDDATLAELAQSGILLSAGHCMASPGRIETARRHGLRGFTHLFNAMPPIESRRPGPVSAALMDDACWCGIIADAIHVDPLLLRLVLRCKKPGRVFLVSDAMPPAGTTDKDFQLDGQVIRRVEGQLRNEAGTLAGADLSLPQAVRTMHELGVDLAEALRMASTYPADFLDLPKLGRIAIGCRADFTLLSPELAVLGTWIQGDWQAASSNLSNETRREPLFR